MHDRNLWGSISLRACRRVVCLNEWYGWCVWKGMRMQLDNQVVIFERNSSKGQHIGRGKTPRSQFPFWEVEKKRGGRRAAMSVNEMGELRVSDRTNRGNDCRVEGRRGEHSLPPSSTRRQQDHACHEIRWRNGERKKKKKKKGKLHERLQIH